MDEAIAQLQALGNFDQRDIQRAVAAANGNLELAASFLMEGGPPRAIPIGHIPNEVRIAMQPGPGKITMAEPPPARPHALLALAREMGAADKLTTLVAEVRRAKEAAEASAEVSRKEGRTTVLAEAEAAAHPLTAEEQQAQRAADARTVARANTGTVASAHVVA